MWRGVVSVIAFSVPLLVLGMPVEWQSMTIGGVLMLLAHYLEKRYLFQ